MLSKSPYFKNYFIATFIMSLTTACSMLLFVLVNDKMQMTPKTLGIIRLSTCFIGINVATIYLYWRDKKIAIGNRNKNAKQRVPETVLHFLCLIGGTFSAIFSQIKFRHKITSKKFRRTFFTIVLFQILCVFLLIINWSKIESFIEAEHTHTLNYGK